MEVGNYSVFAAKLTASSYSDGYSRGVKDAGRDLQGLNGHGYDSSCPSGHTSVFCAGYVQGYDNTWFGKHRVSDGTASNIGSGSSASSSSIGGGSASRSSSSSSTGPIIINNFR
jgi:hypothetical protein